MGMINEIDAACTAEKLEKIILSAMNDSRVGGDRSAVIGFVKDNLVEWYYDECGESWGLHKSNPDIVKMFPYKEK